MFTGEFEFDLDYMRDADYGFSPEYITAYPYTNEPIERWLAISPIKDKRVLTVAASGDQALFYAANGASCVDTFDKTVLACMVMDFKTTALKMHLKYEDYMYLVNNLHYLSVCAKLREPNMSTKLFNQVVVQMPDRTRKIMQSFINPRPGDTAKHCVFASPMQAKTPSPKLYKRFSEIQLPADKQFNFIWADLINVHNYIEGKYDIIYLSNIFDHYINNADHYSDIPNDYKSIWKSLSSLWPYLNVGGYIQFTTFDSMYKKHKYKSVVYNIFKFIGYATKALPIKNFIKFTRDKSYATVVIQKTR